MEINAEKGQEKEQDKTRIRIQITKRGDFPSEGFLERVEAIKETPKKKEQEKEHEQEQKKEQEKEPKFMLQRDLAINRPQNVCIRPVADEGHKMAASTPSKIYDPIFSLATYFPTKNTSFRGFTIRTYHRSAVDCLPFTEHYKAILS